MKENKRNRVNNSHRSTKARRAAQAKKAAKAKKMRFLKKVAFSFIAILVLSITAVGPFGAFRNPNTSTVEAVSQKRELKYKIVDIEYGDSLWSIASDNYTSEYKDMNEYISVIKKCNQLSSDNITAGASLMIPYYE